MSKIKEAFCQTDKITVILCALLSVIGSLIVTSATYKNATIGPLSRDSIVMVAASLAGLILALLISFIDYDIILKLWPVIGGLCLFAMLLLFPFGVAPSARESARSWLKIGPLFFQPSEIVKIGFIITFAFHLNKVKRDISGFRNVALLCLHAAIPILLVVVTGDMGSALIFAMMFVGMMFTAGLSAWYFPAGVLMIAAASPIIWLKVFDDIQRDRILALIHPEDYPAEIYQQQQAANAFGQGGFFGKGLFSGPFTQSDSLPESQNDMVFAAIGEEMGYVGAVILLLLFVFLAVRIIRNGKRAQNFSAYMICMGVMFMITSQVIINIGMCTGLLPVIGITLPFVSAGGSSVICMYISIGLVLSVYRSGCGIGYDSDYRYSRISRK